MVADISIKSNNIRWRTTTLLTALMDGLRVEIGDYVYCFDVDYRLCVVGRNETTGKEALLVTSQDIQQLILLADAMTWYEADVIASNIGLNNLHKHKR